jgi:molybdopterin converting factor small subunit
MDITFFGRLTDLTGNKDLNTDGITNTEELLQRLLDLYPSVSEIPFVIAVNNQIIHGRHILKKGDHISLLPPFSGG